MHLVAVDPATVPALHAELAAAEHHLARSNAVPVPDPLITEADVLRSDDRTMPELARPRQGSQPHFNRIRDNLRQAVKKPMLGSL